jgi:3-oxoadipate enol-lactonase
MAHFVFDNKNIYYEEYGSGAPLILLNGIMMSCMSWKEFIEPLSKHNRLILVDFLDQGKSQSMENEPPYTQDIQVDLVHALIEQFGLGKATIMGISYGSEVALQFALKYPEQLDRLLLFNATARTGPWLGDIGDGWILAEGDADSYYLTTIPVIYSPAFYKEHNDWMNNRRKLLRPLFGSKAFTSAMERLTNSAAKYDVSKEIHNIKVPTLVVSCQQDYLTPIEEQQYIVSQIPDCHYVVIPHCGHASMYEQPTIFAMLVDGFMNLSKVKYNIV